jgi:hypothetical protein
MLIQNIWFILKIQLSHRICCKYTITSDIKILKVVRVVNNKIVALVCSFHIHSEMQIKINIMLHRRISSIKLYLSFHQILEIKLEDMLT